MDRETNPLDELRRVADEMNTYFNYGMRVANMIGIDLLDLKTITGNIYEWPDKPLLPRKLDYESRSMISARSGRKRRRKQ